MTPDTYFLTESVSLGYQRLSQRGIRLDKDRKEFQYEGTVHTGKALPVGREAAAVSPIW